MAILVPVRSLVLTISMLVLFAPNARADIPVPPGKDRALASGHQSWFDRGAEWVREPIVYVVLVALGLIGLIFEIKFPGAIFPGSVAASCFVLFFIAHSFVGEFTLPAVLMFLLGLVFLGIEVFIIPGLVVSGVAGVALMFGGLLLVTLAHWPRDQNDWTNLGATFGSLAIGMALAGVGAVTLAWSLPSIPFLNQMVLKPPPEESDGSSPTSLSNSGLMSLLGAMGVAVTPLRPSGKAQFGERFIDVIADGDYVAPGGQVQVVEIEGPRIVVKEV